MNYNPELLTHKCIYSIINNVNIVDEKYEYNVRTYNMLKHIYLNCDTFLNTLTFRGLNSKESLTLLEVISERELNKMQKWISCERESWGIKKCYRIVYSINKK